MSSYFCRSLSDCSSEISFRHSNSRFAYVSVYGNLIGNPVSSAFFAVTYLSVVCQIVFLGLCECFFTDFLVLCSCWTAFIVSVLRCIAVIFDQQKRFPLHSNNSEVGFRLFCPSLFAQYRNNKHFFRRLLSTGISAWCCTVSALGSSSIVC